MSSLFLYSVLWSAGIIVVQLLLAHQYFQIISNNCSTRKRFKLTSYAISGIFIYLLCYFSSFRYEAALLFYLSIFFIAHAYIDSLGLRMYYSAIYIIVCLILEFAAAIWVVAQQSPEFSVSSGINYRQLIFIYASLPKLLLVLLLRIYRHSKNCRINKSDYLILPVIIVINMYVIHRLCLDQPQRMSIPVTVTYIVLITVFLIVMIELLMKNYTLERDNHLMQQHLEYYDVISNETTSSIEEIKRIGHDTNKQLLYIQMCIQEEKYHEALVHTNKMLRELNQSDKRIFSGNLVIDALVSNMLNIAQENHINVQHDIYVGASDIKIDPYDLCISLGNVLDNALEAVSLVPEQEKRFIRLKSTLPIRFWSFMSPTRGPTVHAARSALPVRMLNSTDLA
ncbi:signal transduction histidine kinase [Fontibacillus solani]|uniref:Signal transduction histidine kinase n=1 Tax=Fontibacillus solani TaxID=1572857 RepID=A0A7W3SPQ0_9BACL|nr:GHKL domain-containing protein [Fontibacillus solani]MBA9083941.1 signal transduction histidine kinase [Fontibacillus solani]